MHLNENPRNIFVIVVVEIDKLILMFMGEVERRD